MSCEDDENINPIIGKWNLIQVSGGWISQQYNSGDIVWRFSEDSLKIEDNIAPSLDEYGYSLIEYENNLFINLADVTFITNISYIPSIEINNNEMTINPTIVLDINQNDTTMTSIQDAGIYFFEKQ